MTEWRDVALKVADIFAARCAEIRSEVPVDDILQCAKDSLSTREVNLKIEDIPVESFVRLANDINGAHRRKIREAADGLGVVESEFPLTPTQDSRTFVSEDDSSLLLKIEGMFLRVSKDTAMKVVVLGSLP